VGDAPKRVIVTAFDNVDEAQTWRKDLQRLRTMGTKPSLARLVISATRLYSADDKPRPVASICGPGRFQNKCEMKLPWMDPRLRELFALAVLAALGCGLALSQGDLWFADIFGAACAVTIIEAI
jgi:hypothetical protein